MQNLKINSTSTPYWCVVVPVDAEDIKFSRDNPTEPTYINYLRKSTGEHYRDGFDIYEMGAPEYYSILGCITSSGMDEGVREMVQFIHIPTAPAVIYRNYVNDEHFILWQNSVKSLLEHNQITLTADQKAVVVKQIT